MKRLTPPAPLAPSLLAFALATASAACRDAPPPLAVEAAPGDPLAAKGGPSAQSRLGLLRTRENVSADRTRQRIQYHGGPVMLGTVNVYYIWYGDWSGSTAPGLLEEFVVDLGGSAYFAINTLYPDAAGFRPANSVFYGGAMSDDYSRGRELVDSDVQAIVLGAIENRQLPQDPRALYIVLGSPDVSVSDARYGLCTDYCGFHHYTNFDNMALKFAFVGSPERCPSKCAFQEVGPNGTLDADAMASHIAALMSAVVTDPQLSAWYDRLGLENADKCAWDFGPTYDMPNGAKANVRLGARHYLLQRNWVPARRGYCAMEAPSASALAAEGGEGEGQ